MSVAGVSVVRGVWHLKSIRFVAGHIFLVYYILSSFVIFAVKRDNCDVAGRLYYAEDDDGDAVVMTTTVDYVGGDQQAADEAA